MWCDSQGLTGKGRLQFCACPYRSMKSFFSGFFRAGLHNPSSVCSSDFPMSQDVLFCCGGAVLQDFCHSLSTARPLSLKRMEMLCGVGRNKGRGVKLIILILGITIKRHSWFGVLYLYLATKY